MARMARITENRPKNKQTTMDVAPNASSATCGNRFVGCTFAKTEKKFPSNAAAYGTREYPSVAEKHRAERQHQNQRRRQRRPVHSKRPFHEEAHHET